MKYFLLISLVVLIASAQDCKISGEDKGDDSKCANLTGGGDRAVCCYFTRLGDAKAWTCGWVPTEAEQEAYDKAADALGDDYDAEAYCDNAFLMKVSFFVVAITALFAF